MLKIGITGGIGSGKTTVAGIFQVLGVPVYSADDAARRLMNEEGNLKKAVIELFGKESYLNGQLNRPFIASIVFNQPDKLQQLNALVHPATIKDAAHWMHLQNTPYVIKEAALMFESAAGKEMDKIVGVYAPSAVRLKRAMQRDSISREAVLARMDKQIDETIKMKLCDYVIKNDDREMVIPQVIELHQKFLKMAQQLKP